jgi:hypothetical protein
MIKADENALICDLAETYHIYDYKQLPAFKVAVFSIGLRDDSRIKMKLSNQKVSTETLLLAGIFDRLSILAWFKTADGQKGTNRPESIVEQLTAEPKERKEMVFTSGEEFERARKEILEKIGGEH